MGRWWCLSVGGLRLAILCLLHTSVESMVWFGTPCSSWSVMCMVHCRRYESNFYLGDESRQFVRTSDKLMEVSAMLYFLTHLMSNIAKLEEPKDCVMPKCSTMKLVFGIFFVTSHQDLRISFWDKIAKAVANLEPWWFNCSINSAKTWHWVWTISWS